MVPWSYLGWRVRKVQKRVVHHVCSRFFQDRERSTRRSIMVAGAPRSGTTWLGDILAAQAPARTMFEPFHAKYVSAFSDFNYFQYKRPWESDPALLAYCHTVFTGAIRHPWIDQQVNVLFPRLRVIKEVRANLFLRWINQHFPDLPILFIVRHPCAVVLSRMQLNWDPSSDIQPLLEQETLMSDFLCKYEDVISSASSLEEQNAVLWCVNNLVPLTQFQHHDLNVIFYEDLCTSPDDVLEQMCRPLGIKTSEFRRTVLQEPSLTSSRKSAIVQGGDLTNQWQSELTRSQVSAILSVVKAFGLDYLYGDQSTPLTRFG